MQSTIINTNKLRDLLENMIRIPSINPSSLNLGLSHQGTGEAKLATYIAAYMEKLGIEVQYERLDENRANVIGIWKGTGGGRSIMLNGHMDTVGIEHMKIEPFTPEFKDGKIFGRGAGDMKGGIASQIMAVQSLIEAGKRLRGDVLLTFVADEEYGSIGTESVLKSYSADAAIVCEPTGLDIVIAHKGFAWIDVEVFGRAVHGSKPEEGIDAIAKAGKILVEVERLGEEILPQKTHPLLGSPSIHASLIQGGSDLSTYPGYCKIQLERRNLPGEDMPAISEEIQNLLSEIGSQDSKFKAESDVFSYRPAFEISREQPIIQSLSRSYISNCGEQPQFVGESGWMDSALLDEAGIPVVCFGPAGEGFHAEIECIDFNSMITTTEILIETMTDFCNSKK
ncbi:MAG: peptidase M20 [Bacteroidetes bacterium]|nr:MAG: peptidase M20 [Bacteroidota bacterium]